MTGMPLLLLPGLLLDRRLFEPQIEALADVAEVSVGDLARHDDIGAAADALLEQAPARFALGGLSMGGYVALEIMRRAPGRVSHLILLDTQAQPDSEDARRRRLDQIATAEGGGFAALKDQLLPGWVHPERRADDTLMSLLDAMAESSGADGFMREQRLIMSRPDSMPSLSPISCPTLVLCGREDATTPVARHVEMAQAIPYATLVVVPKCGHLSTLEHPWLVGQAMRTLLAA